MGTAGGGAQGFGCAHLDGCVDIQTHIHTDGCVRV